jgi:hypothetical protein
MRYVIYKDTVTHSNKPNSRTHISSTFKASVKKHFAEPLGLQADPNKIPFKESNLFPSVLYTNNPRTTLELQILRSFRGITDVKLLPSTIGKQLFKRKKDNLYLGQPMISNTNIQDKETKTSIPLLKNEV